MTAYDFYQRYSTTGIKIRQSYTPSNKQPSYSLYVTMRSTRGNLLVLCTIYQLYLNRIVVSQSINTASFTSNIVDGEPSPVGRFPYFAHPVGFFVCGATLIHEDILLTAAHCNDGRINFLSASAIYIGSTQFDGSDAIETMSATSFRNHPKYDAFSLSKFMSDSVNLDVVDNYIYDYSLVKLSRSSTVTPAPWNVNPAQPLDNEELVTIGYGTISQDGPLSAKLLEVKVNVTKFATCDANYNNELDAASTLCAAAPGKDSCNGDSGGPILNANGTIVGIVSLGIGCALPQFPGVYSRVSEADTFIRQGICEMSSNPPDYCDTLQHSGSCTTCRTAIGLSGSLIQLSLAGRCIQTCSIASFLLRLIGGKCGSCA